MQEEDALSHAPEGSSAELIRAGATLCNTVGEAFAHVMNEQVGEKVRGPVGKGSTGSGRGATRNHCSRGQRRGVAVDTTDCRKHGASLFAGRCGGRGSGRSQ